MFHYSQKLILAFFLLFALSFPAFSKTDPKAQAEEKTSPAPKVQVKADSKTAPKTSKVKADPKDQAPKASKATAKVAPPEASKAKAKLAVKKTKEGEDLAQKTSACKDCKKAGCKKDCKEGKKCKSCDHYAHSKGKKCKKKGFFKRLFSSCKSKKCGFESDPVSGYALVSSVGSNQVQGEVFFNGLKGKKKSKKYGGIEVKARFKGLKPNSQFGFHIHEFGNCGERAAKAGAHFNPRGKKHGGAHSKERHMGDLGNLVSDSKGEAVYHDVVRGYYKKFLGRSVVVHVSSDDGKTQPSGDAKDRMACGVIVATQYESPDWGIPLAPSQEEEKKVKTKKRKKAQEDFDSF